MANETAQVESFVFSEQDFRYELSPGVTENSSRFDQALQASWRQHMDAGHFTYKLEKVVSRVMAGKYGYVAQYTPERGNQRRMPQVAYSTCQDSKHTEICIRSCLYVPSFNALFFKV